jgi:hypothetical protein
MPELSVKPVSSAQAPGAAAVAAVAAAAAAAGVAASAPVVGAVTDTTTAARPREIGGPSGLEPTRFGDWEKAGRCIDF